MNYNMKVKATKPMQLSEKENESMQKKTKPSHWDNVKEPIKIHKTWWEKLKDLKYEKNTTKS